MLSHRVALSERSARGRRRPRHLPAAGSHYATQPARKNKPSCHTVAKSHRIPNPNLERIHARRAHSYTIKVEGASHSVYESHPKEVAALIDDAAPRVGGKSTSIS
jgi:pimeloyl-ACP methyl ester carboxylesterase